MKRIALIAGLILMLGEYPAWAGQGHSYVGVEDCRCYGAACTPITTTDIGLPGVPAKPLFQLTDSSSASYQCEFWFPVSHTTADTNFILKPHFLKGGAGVEQYWYRAGYAVLPDETSSPLSWGAVVGNEGVTNSVDHIFDSSCATNSGAVYHKTSCDNQVGFNAYNVAATATCTYAACAGNADPTLAHSNPGMLFVQRISSTQAGSGATTPRYEIGFDILWTTP